MNSIASPMMTAWLARTADVYTREKDRLTALDAAIGDADHGVNMARGFTAVAAKIPEMEGKDIGAVLKLAAMTLISTVGGASGPLFGSFFLQAASRAPGKSTLSKSEFGACLDAGLKAVASRGKASLGDKTMLDALEPAVKAYLSTGDGEPIPRAIRAACDAARAGADATIPMVARKGRASYLGERSAGHLDPGAESTVLLLQCLRAALEA